MSQIRPARPIVSARGCMLALLLAGGLPGVAAACTPTPSDMDPSAGTPRYWEYTGDREPLMGWIEVWGSAAIPSNQLYRGCATDASVFYEPIEFSPDLTYAGYEVDGAAVFDVGTQLGVQFQIATHDGSGNWFGYQNVGAGGLELNGYHASGNVFIKIRYRYIATAYPSSDRLDAGEFSWNFTNLSRPALSYSKTTNAHAIHKYVPPPEPTCYFSANPPKTLPLPDGHAMKLKNPGDTSDPVSFSWRFGCNSTSPGAEIVYTPTTNYSGLATGRMAIEAGAGAAEGVEIEVRRATSSSATKAPVRFGSSYYRGTSGTEYLDVRYVRTTGDLKAGLANAGLKIEVDTY